MVIWFVRAVLGTVVIGLLQVFGLLFGVGCVWLSWMWDEIKNLCRRRKSVLLLSALLLPGCAPAKHWSGARDMVDVDVTQKAEKTGERP